MINEVREYCLFLFPSHLFDWSCSHFSSLDSTIPSFSVCIGRIYWRRAKNYLLPTTCLLDFSSSLSHFFFCFLRITITASLSTIVFTKLPEIPEYWEKVHTSFLFLRPFPKLDILSSIQPMCTSVRGFFLFCKFSCAWEFRKHFWDSVLLLFLQINLIFLSSFLLLIALKWYRLCVCMP